LSELQQVSQPAAEIAEIGVPWGGVRRAAVTLDIVIGRLAEAAGALLVLVETCILFAGVVSRYVFNSPIIWTDELANFLFLWLSMIGAVVALRHDGHMRLTTFVNWCAPKWGRWFGTVAELVVIVFVIEIIVQANAYLNVQASTELITLHISDWYRVVALVVGAGLIATVALLRLLETATPRNFLSALLVLAETCILFAGVVSRYVFNSQIIWTDELATFLFLWLSMFGAVVAVRRDGHMRLTTFTNWVSP